MLNATINRIFDWLEQSRDPFPRQAATTPPTDFVPFVIHYIRPFWKLLAVSSLLAAIVAILEVSLFAILGNLVDWLAKSDPQTLWADHGTFLMACAGLILIILPVLKFAYESVIHQGLMGNLAMRVRWQAHRYVLRQSVGFFQDDFAGRISAKVMQTALAVRQFVMTLAEVLLYVSVYFTGALIAFTLADWRLAIPMLLWLAGYIAAIRYFVPRLKVVSTEQSDARSIMTGRIVDSYTNIQTVKMFAHADREDDYARESMEGFLDTTYRQMRLVTWLTVTLNLLNAFLLSSVAATGIWLWSVGAVTTGALALSVGLVLRMQGMSHWIMWEVAGLFEHIGVIQDGMGMLTKKQTVLDAPDAVPLDVKQGAIQLRDVGFHYGKEGGIIDNMSLAIKPGEKVGLVGRSGAGKSTLVNLLLRFYDLERGKIRIDHQDIAQVTQESLRAQIGMVTQDTSLLHRSVLDNITYGRPDASRNEAVAAAKRAHAHDFILDLEDQKGRSGYDAHVGERGVKLSGGQRQRIAIARVLLKNAPILILDEATSALDSEVEAAIQDSLNDLMSGKTVIAIAHRLSTIAAMDRLVVMDRGEIVEDGSHDELIARGGLYAELWARQSGGFLARQAAE
ncbi:MAG: ABC transporter ATP-binding protein/permease [Alphaproteobacteria bacterium]|nr:ABC transporter ATP-binding protein/permease [Alphaproteobacteria bacterium]